VGATKFTLGVPKKEKSTPVVQDRHLDCDEVFSAVGVERKERCCARCHEKGQLFIFVVQPANKHAAVCCHTATTIMSTQLAKKEAPLQKRVEVVLDPADVEDVLAS
jgi:hypothetical protein